MYFFFIANSNMHLKQGLAFQFDRPEACLILIGTTCEPNNMSEI